MGVSTSGVVSNIKSEGAGVCNSSTTVSEGAGVGEEVGNGTGPVSASANEGDGVGSVVVVGDGVGATEGALVVVASNHP